MTSPSGTESRGRERRSDAPCPGRMANGLGKRFTRCERCGRIDYEKNEGDVCGSETSSAFVDPDGLWEYR